MIDIIFGVNIVEIVTSGLYPNALDTFREYIQNSCDAIDDALKAGILQEGDGKISIDINIAERRITIEDNGSGLGTRYFESTMSSIGKSEKSLETDRGFRGIGRLCGLAYCKTLVFSTKAAGEKKISTLTINAENLRETFFHKNKYLAEQVLSSNMIFSTHDTDDAENHFFRVEMLDVINDALLKVELEKYDKKTGKGDDPTKITSVRNYLSFVAPVTYSPQFTFQQKIYAYAAALNFKITEYKICVNGEPLVKNYKDNFTTKNGKDKIFDVTFKDFRDKDGNLIAWSWIGLSMFKGVIQRTKENPNLMRSIRLRTGNIQIGNENVFQNRKLFTEDRGTTYFIGEVHTVDKNLRPNSRRDYFEENDALKILEDELRTYFEELYKLYHHASDVRSAFKAMNQPEIFEQEIKTHTIDYQETHKAEHDAKIDKLLDKAAEKEELINKARRAAKDNPNEISSRVFEKIDAENSSTIIGGESTSTPNPPPTRQLPLESWSDETKNIYNKIHEIILGNKTLKGKELLDRINAELAK